MIEVKFNFETTAQVRAFLDALDNTKVPASTLSNREDKVTATTDMFTASVDARKLAADKKLETMVSAPAPTEAPKKLSTKPAGLTTTKAVPEGLSTKPAGLTTNKPALQISKPKEIKLRDIPDVAGIPLCWPEFAVEEECADPETFAEWQTAYEEEVDKVLSYSKRAKELIDAGDVVRMKSNITALAAQAKTDANEDILKWLKNTKQILSYDKLSEASDEQVIATFYVLLLSIDKFDAYCTA